MSETIDHEQEQPEPELQQPGPEQPGPQQPQPQQPEHTPAGAGEQFDADPSPTSGEHGMGGAPGTPDAPGTQGGGAYELQDADLRRVSEVPLELSVEIGRTQMTVGETLDLRAGSIVTLDRLAGEPVDLLVNGTPIAHGEVVVVDEQFGMRVTGIIECEDAQDANGGPAVAAGAQSETHEEAA